MPSLFIPDFSMTRAEAGFSVSQNAQARKIEGCDKDQFTKSVNASVINPWPHNGFANTYPKETLNPSGIIPIIPCGLKEFLVQST